MRAPNGGAATLAAVRGLLHALPWVLLSSFPLIEVGAHVYTRSQVASRADYAAAATFIRPQLQARDLVTSAPQWADPLLREALGDRIDLAMAGRSDSAAYERLWSISQRGATPPEASSAEASRPVLERSFGPLRVQRWELGKSPVLYHFSDHLAQAQVAVRQDGRERICRLRRHAPSPGGGLGVGVVPPRDRTSCEGAADSSWVGAVVLEDLELRPRRCVFQPVASPAPLRVTFEDVPLGDRLVFYGGLYYEDERMREGAPIRVTIAIDGTSVASMTHRDGDGWKRLVVPTSGGTGKVAIEVTSSDAHKRRFCWDATTRSGAARGER